ncbi:hypothetical protein [Thermosynechococcus sp.]|uniref:hypothetical protein n=1 Tax=Thermosynechococcus sp. TaxID=2814275 RepID=UPI003918FF02
MTAITALSVSQICHWQFYHWGLAMGVVGGAIAGTCIAARSQFGNYNGIWLRVACD